MRSGKEREGRGEAGGHSLFKPHTLVSPGTTTAGLQDAIVAAYPALAEIKDAIVLAVNQSYVDGEARPLAEGDEVAVIPPISGG